MRLNLGCGHNKLDGWLNVDKFPTLKPDFVQDLEALPWPWADGSCEEILLKHVLEHLGQSPDAFIGVMKEMHRVCRDGATVTIFVPHPRHDDFLNDPTHVRPITADTLLMFSQKANRDFVQRGVANSTLALTHGIDFDLVTAQATLDDPWRSDFDSGKLKPQDIDRAVRNFANVVKEMKFVLKAVKPG